MKTDIYSLKKGDRIKILARPEMWASALSWNCPLYKCEFPKIITIVEIEQGAMKCDENYGWSLSSINDVGWKLLSSEEEEEHFLGFI